MSNTYSQMYIQVVFPVQNRLALIDESWEVRLHKYITGIIQGKGQKMLAINGMPNHLHFFIGIRPDCRLSDLVMEVKKISNKYINDNKLSQAKFKWQEGFGSFSYSRSHIDRVAAYVMNQKEHHKKQTFKEEYIGLLKEYDVEYNEKYLFEWI